MALVAGWGNSKERRFWGGAAGVGSKGRAAAFGDNSDGQCTISALNHGVLYVQLAAGNFHTELLEIKNTAAACAHGSYLGKLHPANGV